MLEQPESNDSGQSHKLYSMVPYGRWRAPATSQEMVNFFWFPSIWRASSTNFAASVPTVVRSGLSSQGAAWWVKLFDIQYSSVGQVLCIVHHQEILFLQAIEKADPRTMKALQKLLMCWMQSCKRCSSPVRKRTRHPERAQSTQPKHSSHVPVSYAGAGQGRPLFSDFSSNLPRQRFLGPRP